MKKQNQKQAHIEGDDHLPDSTINGNFTAQPKDLPSDHRAGSDADLAEANMDYGNMTLKDAKTSGYTDSKGHAIDMAKKEPVGHPTGAYTDIGAGRSSAVVTKSEMTKNDLKRSH